ncbi:MAG: hypothetical protein AABW75_03355 [Nanoarchaeota archaeon]
MKEENAKIIEEVNDEIEASLKDQKGIVAHQRRLTFSFSLGVVALIEDYLEKKRVLKQGAKINHRWFKKNKENVKKFIANQITSPVKNPRTKVRGVFGFLNTSKIKFTCSRTEVGSLRKFNFLSIEEIKELDEILDITYKIEHDRDLLAYGKSSNEKILKEKIDLFLSFKRRIEND